MKNGWTGGQYSLFRWVFGIYLFVHFLQLVAWGGEVFSSAGVLPEAASSPVIHLFPNILAVWDSPEFVTILLMLAAGLAVLLAVGQFDRIAAVGLWYIWACLYGRNPLIANPSIPYVGLLLLAHACISPSSWGFRASKAQAFGNNQWRMADSIYTVIWILMAVGYTYSGATKLASPSWLNGRALSYMLDNPLARGGVVSQLLLSLPDVLLRLATWGAMAFELCFAPLALVRRLRPWLWAGMFCMHLCLIVAVDFADLSLGMVMLHLFTFDPAWVRAAKSATTETVFYDGHCGLCNRVVRFVLAEDLTLAAFRFAAFNSETFRTIVPEKDHSSSTNSLMVIASDGKVLRRSAAVLHILRQLGGIWKLFAGLGVVIPVNVRDYIYDGIARIRYRFFRFSTATCPLIPDDMKARFAP
jgi:predicted DCC family thiol-disulfide oxidoreductase YuxK